jgi:hypothetical protein
VSSPLILCYSNGGLAFRAVDPGYVPGAGEVLFNDYATPAQLATAFPGYVAPVPPVLLPKALVASRVNAAGKLPLAQSNLWADPSAWMKWFDPGYPNVDASDQKLIAFITALGLDPTVILAP